MEIKNLTMYLLVQYKINLDKTIKEICKEQNCKFIPSLGYWDGLVLIKSNDFNEIKNKQKKIANNEKVELHQECFLDEVIVNGLGKNSKIKRVSLIFNAEEKNVVKYCKENKIALIKTVMGATKYILFCDDYEKYNDWGQLNYTDLILKEEIRLDDLI